MTKNAVRTHQGNLPQRPAVFAESFTHQRRLLVPNHRWAVPARNPGAPRLAFPQEFFLMPGPPGCPPVPYTQR